MAAIGVLLLALGGAIIVILFYQGKSPQDAITEVQQAWQLPPKK